MNTDSLLLLIDDQTISDKQGQQAAVSKIHNCFGLCNVMTAFAPPPPSKGYFMRISTVVSVLKGGKYSLRYLHWKQLNEKYEIYRQTIKS
jgi:hypothetical protein